MRMARRLRAERGDHGLTLTQLAAMATLHRHGAMTPGELAAHERDRPPSMTRTVTGLENLGLVVRTPDPEDGRQVLVSLSEQGQDILRADRAQREQWLARRLAALDPSDRATLQRAAAILDRLAGT